mmetsp:Transcript_30490/g.42472  ORF Transcript_30490/g.42472 Transcript_30490/m.42472 type:complete len:160 (+) Transcript_30490:178-657(+)
MTISRPATPLIGTRSLPVTKVKRRFFCSCERVRKHFQKNCTTGGWVAAFFDFSIFAVPDADADADDGDGDDAAAGVAVLPAAAGDDKDDEEVGDKTSSLGLIPRIGGGGRYCFISACRPSCSLLPLPSTWLWRLGPAVAVAASPVVVVGVGVGVVPNPS